MAASDERAHQRAHSPGEHDCDWRHDEYRERVHGERVAGTCSAVRDWKHQRDDVVRGQWKRRAPERVRNLRP